MSEHKRQNSRSNPRGISVRLEHYNISKTRFQIRHDARVGPQPGHVDPARSHLNSCVDGPSAVEYRDLMLTRRTLTQPQRAAKMKTVAVMTSGIITFGHLVQADVLSLAIEQQDAMYREIAQAICAHLGNELTALAVHRDETAPHAHFQMPARRPDGLRMSEVVTPAIASRLQDIASEIAARHVPGIERGTPKAITGARHRTVAQLHRDQAMDIAGREAQIGDLDRRIEDGEQRMLDLEALQQSAETDARHFVDAAGKARTQLMLAETSAFSERGRTKVEERRNESLKAESAELSERTENVKRAARDEGLRQVESVLSATRQLISGDIGDLLSPTTARIRTATLECRVTVQRAREHQQVDPFARHPTLRTAVRDIQSCHGAALSALREDLCKLQKRQSDWQGALKAAALAERVQTTMAELARWWQEAAELVLGMFRKLGLERLQRLGLISQVIDLLPDEGQFLDPLRAEIELETGIVALARAIATPQQAAYR
ncbi:plasmid recombination protein [Gemmobacter sp.]|uniref:plasmid recombination protein n=1 Tax=Gemmobacter sp. TaxID=1898957 RepID=UPI002AFF3A95|nr:plasmid recombination protein [Gemmobacter sp.]